MKILILGGYGVFGGRLVQLLSDTAGLHLVIAGRSGGKARAFCETCTGRAHLTALKLDRVAAPAALGRLKPDLVVDASGPFQAYGDDPYALPWACIAAGVPYMDFADGADFVAGISSLDADARARDVFALSGVSSFPVLTAAVMRHLCDTLKPRRIEAGIAPSPFAGVGMNVMRAVMGYAGEPLTLTRDGTPRKAHALAESRRYTVAPPGDLPLANLRFSLVDVPDLQVIPPLWPGVTEVWMGAGPVPEVLHRALNLLAKVRAARLLPNLKVLAPLCFRVLNALKFGDHRGGMYVEVEGQGPRGPEVRSWHLLAEGDDGPLIPSMAIAALIRRMLEGHPPQPGARPATAELELADYLPLFAERTITTGTRRETGGTLYRRLLGDALDRLPAPVVAIHDTAGSQTWEGRAAVTRSASLRGRLASWLLRLPKASADIPVSVTFTRDGAREIWDRSFGQQHMRSIQTEGAGRDARLLVERLGPVKVSMALVVKGSELHLVPRRWSLLGLPLPRRWLPGGTSFEAAPDGVFRFDVEYTSPLTGPIATYTGWLAPRRARHRRIAE